MPEVIDWQRRHDVCDGFLADALRAFPNADRITGELLEDLRDARAHCIEKLAEGAVASATATAAAPPTKAASPDLYPGFRDPFTDEWIPESLPRTPGDDDTGLEDYGPGAPILPEPTAPRAWERMPSPGYPTGDTSDETGFE
jgi:hypothetical protein